MERALLAALGACLCTAGAPGATAGFSRPTSGQTLRAGTTASIEWALSPGLPDFREMELLLSLDGGRTFRLRVTREVGPATSAILWRVPALPTRHARLALRTGAGDGDEEAVRLVSDEFEILADSPQPAEELFEVGGEWRTRDALVLPVSLPPLRALEPDPPLIQRLDPGTALTAPRQDSVGGHRRLSSEELRAAGRGNAPPATPPAPARVALIPLRE